VDASASAADFDRAYRRVARQRSAKVDAGSKRESIRREAKT
jgi:hypothetical protein